MYKMSLLKYVSIETIRKMPEFSIYIITININKLGDYDRRSNQ